MIELCCEYLSVRYCWLYAIIVSRTRFRVNLHSIVSALFSSNKAISSFFQLFHRKNLVIFSNFKETTVELSYLSVVLAKSQEKYKQAEILKTYKSDTMLQLIKLINR